MLVKKYKDLSISISATTRPKRPLEEEGRDYYFLTKSEFAENVKKAHFLEYEEVHGDYYGTLKNRVQELLNRGKAIIFDIPFRFVSI